MDCEEYGEKLSAYVDGELDYDSRARLEKHLASCPDCRAALEQMRKIESVRPALEPGDVPEEKWRECWEEIKKQTTGSLSAEKVASGLSRRRRARNIRRLLAAAGLVAAAIVVAAVLFWPEAAPVEPEAPAMEDTVCVLDYDDSNYSLYVIDKPEYTIIKLIPVDEQGGG